MSHPEKSVLRHGVAVDLSNIELALRSLEGVDNAEVRLAGDDRSRVVGVLTLTQGVSLTPEEALAGVREKYPPSHWPDQILVTYQQTDFYSERRAA